MATETASRVSDAIVVGEGWISEHFFTTDAKKESFQALVLERAKTWKTSQQEDGHPTPRSRFTATRSGLLDSFALLEEGDVAGAEALHKQLLDILGYRQAGLISRTDGPLTLIHRAGLDDLGLAIVEAKPAHQPDDLLAKNADNLIVPFESDEGEELRSVARLLSWLFTDEHHKPPFVLVLAGAQCLVAERERWPEGRYLALNLQLVAERNDTKNGGEIDRALTCLSAESLAPDDEGTTWWHQALDASVQHTVGVSQDLRDGVRHSIEIIANEAVHRRQAQGLAPLPPDQAQPLAKQSLRFLYRILFLLYAEASPELGVLPTGAREYDTGYSIDRLRELTLVDLTTPRSRNGTHLYDSLAVLFHLVDQGHQPTVAEDEDRHYVEGLTFRSLRADLFQPAATSLINEVELGNAALQQVLQHLLLSKATAKKERGFISYAELGINQLGAVYEGLMSYTGRFAEEDLYEVAKDGNSEKGSWLVPISRSETIAAKDFVTVVDPYTGETKPRIHHQGDFVFRLAGRERQQSASYYTPEVLTRFTVGQALEELLDQDGHTTTAAEILDMSICEPALGSGAFAIEAVRQLAEQYLERRQAELGERIDPDQYPRELQQVKAHLALHNTYGVDLNSTAVELAEISLWLDTMVEGLQAPWFGLHLRRGNSLIGARRDGFTPAELLDKTYLKAVPSPIDDRVAGEGRAGVSRSRIHHFLVPAEGWGAAAEVKKDIKDLVPDAVASLKTWRKQVRARASKKQVERLDDLAQRVEALWKIATKRLTIAEQQVRRDLPLWGAGHAGGASAGESRSSSSPERGTREGRIETSRLVTREEIEASLADRDGAYRRLRRVMDAWCALWFWPLTETDTAPPTLDQWYDALAMILGSGTTMSRAHARRGDDTFADVQTWDELDDAEHNDRVYAGARPMAEVLDTHPWLRVCARVADAQGFFHWGLDFAPVFARGGFDLQVGNPPWVRPRTDVNSLLAEGDPWWQLKSKSTAQQDAEHREQALAVAGVEGLLIEATADIVALAEYLGAAAQYPHLVGLQPDLYRCFMEQTWRHARSAVADSESTGVAGQTHAGVVSLVHPDGHFTDEKARALRGETYRRLRRHWYFHNTLKLFEVSDHVKYGVHTYGAPRDPSFLQATSLYHPDTVVRSLRHDGAGEEPGLKDPDGNWDLRPHRSRIQHVDTDTLATWHAVLEPGDVPVDQSRMVYTVNRSTAAVLDKLASAPRIGELGLSFSAGWHEKNDRTKGYFDAEWGVPESWDDVILQGPHLHVANPMYKTPNQTMLHNQDWTAVDLEALPADAIPATSYKPRGNRAEYDAAYTHWDTNDGRRSARDFYRVAWRMMAANTGERTLIPSVLPPGAAHIHGIYSGGGVDARALSLAVGSMSTLLSDFATRAVPKATISPASVDRGPVSGPLVHDLLRLRSLRMLCVTSAYDGLWHEAGAHTDDSWAGGIDYPGRQPLSSPALTWDERVPLRRSSDRRQAQLEVDVLAAIGLGVTADELCTIYRTQFPVLYGYDRNAYFYDANGRLVPNEVLTVWRKKGDDLTREERSAVHPGSGVTYQYALPFTTLDREADMRHAYEVFEERLARRRSNSV